MLEFQRLRKLWGIVIDCVPKSWIESVEFEGAYDGWQRDVAYAGAAPRAQHIGRAYTGRACGSMPAMGLLTLMYPEFIRLNDPDNEKYMYGPQRLDFVRVCTSVTTFTWSQATIRNPKRWLRV